MDFHKFKLGVGPMSKSVVALCLEYSSHYKFPIMFIASRNQADYDSGYAFTTSELVDVIRNSEYYNPDRVLICRDHCGPYFSDNDDGLSLTDSVAACLKTIEADCNANFDLIHIDVSRIDAEQQFDTAEVLFDYVRKFKPDMAFEFGTEDNTGTNLKDSMQKLQQQLEFIEAYKPYVKFVVSQTGSLTKHTQVGTFDPSDNMQIAELIHNNGILFKEHNADYLNADEVNLRKTTGVDSINIAPQLGSVQSSVMLYYKNHCLELFETFYNEVLEAGYWQKWVTPDVTDNDTKFIAGAHYCYESTCGKLLLDELSNCIDFAATLRMRVYDALDQYRIGYEL
jgi:hypothetical protein